MKPTVYRQGDVFIVPVKKHPDLADRHARHGVLARGEATGHAHRILDPASADVFSHGDDLFIEVLKSEATVRHEEHGPVVLPRGKYRVQIQREYSPEEIRRVVD